MKVEFWMTGKTDHKYLIEGIDLYSKRIRHYIPFNIQELNIPKPKVQSQYQKTESEYIYKLLNNDDHLILLDEKGHEYSSREFSDHLQKLFQFSASRLIFLAGGAYGFDKILYQRANQTLSLSKMTFPHDLCRLVFLEQLYRALTIAHNHPYQH